MLSIRRIARNRTRVISTALFLMTLPLAASSQLLGLTWPGLTREDVEGMDSASQKVLQEASDHAVVQWENPDSNRAGVVRLVRSYEAHCMSCRVLDYTIRFEETGNQPDHYAVNWCRLPDGEWKIVELAG